MRVRSIIISALMICGRLFADDAYNIRPSADTVGAAPLSINTEHTPRSPANEADTNVYIRGIEIYGNVKTRERTLRQIFAFDIGEVLDTSKIRITKERLQDTRLFDKVDVFPFMREDGAHIFVVLKEGVRLQLGYGGDYYTHRYGIADLWLYLVIDFTLENFRGRMEELSVRARGWDRKTLDLAWYRPFLSTPYFMEIGGGIENIPGIRLPIDYTDMYALAAVGRKFGRYSRVSLSAVPTYRHMSIVGSPATDNANVPDDADIPSVSADAAAPQSTPHDLIPDDFKSDLYEAFAAAGYVSDHRNARFDPSSGWLFSSRLRTNRLYSGVQTPFFQLTNEFRYYTPLLFGDVAALRLRLTLRDVDAGEYHRLVYGGAATIRGYGSDALGWKFPNDPANSSLLASIKYHKRLYRTPQTQMPFIGSIFSGVNMIHFRFDATLIADYARIYSEPQGVLTFSGPRQDGAGLGFGIRILTPEIRQSGCIDLVFGKIDNPDGGHRWEPTLHVYLDYFY